MFTKTVLWCMVMAFFVTGKGIMNSGVERNSTKTGTCIVFGRGWHAKTGVLTQPEKDGRSWRSREVAIERASRKLHFSLVLLFFGIDYNEVFFRRIRNDAPAIPREGGSNDEDVT